MESGGDGGVGAEVWGVVVGVRYYYNFIISISI